MILQRTNYTENISANIHNPKDRGERGKYPRLAREEDAEGVRRKRAKRVAATPSASDDWPTLGIFRASRAKKESCSLKDYLQDALCFNVVAPIFDELQAKQN